MRNGLTALALLLVGQASAHAFCGFYVASASGPLYNEASEVVIARNGERTTISMLNNYRGALKQFALVVPVPPGITKADVHVVPVSLFQDIEAWSAPRLVEYWEQNPCPPLQIAKPDRMVPRGNPSPSSSSHGVAVVAAFAVGEYDIVVLSAKEAHGLATWLTSHHYQIPAGAADVLAPYIAAGTQFFVAKVNLERLAHPKPQPQPDADTLRAKILDMKAGSQGTELIVGRGTNDGVARGGKGVLRNRAGKQVGTFVVVNASATSTHVRTVLTLDQLADIRDVVFTVAVPPLPPPTAGSPTDGVLLSPLSFSFKSKTVTLPIRLGTINGHGTQDLLVFMLSRTGRFDVTSYPNPKIPSDLDVPESTASDFKQFYLTQFDAALAKQHGKAVFTEYVWDSGSCDPCAGQPLAPDQLAMLGMSPGGAAYVTRLHARYTKETFQKDLVFAETTDTAQFQARYIIRHPWRGEITCSKPKRGVWGGQ